MLTFPLNFTIPFCKYVLFYSISLFLINVNFLTCYDGSFCIIEIEITIFRNGDIVQGHFIGKLFEEKLEWCKTFKSNQCCHLFGFHTFWVKKTKKYFSLVRGIFKTPPSDACLILLIQIDAFV